MAVIWLFLRSPIGRYCMAGLAVFVLLLGIYAKGRHDGAGREKAAEAARVARAVVKAAKVTTTLSVAADKAGADASAERERIVYRTNTVIQRVTQDVPIGSVADVRLGAGFVRNYAAGLGLPEDPRLAGLPADQPVISAADALRGIDGNSGTCLAYRDAYQRVVKLYDETRDQVNGFRP